MIERLLLTAGIIGILGVTVAFSGFMQRTRVSQTARQFVDGRTPTLLYFWSEVCTPCKTVQTPALDQLEADMPMLDVVRINALEQPELASKWGVMTVPTTILLNEEGQPIHINNRPVRLPELRQQLGDLGAYIS